MDVRPILQVCPSIAKNEDTSDSMNARKRLSGDLADGGSGEAEAPGPRSGPSAPGIVAAWLLLTFAALFVLSVPAAAQQTTVWSATLTVRNIFGDKGCDNSEAGNRKCSNSNTLSEDEFTDVGTDYTVTALYVSGSALILSLNTGVTTATQSLTLMIGGNSYAFADGIPNGNSTRWTWANSGLTWSTGDEVSVSLVGTNTAATGQPTISGTPQTGKTLTAAIDDIKDDNGLPSSASDFTYQWLRVDGSNNETNIGSNSSTYTVTGDDEGHTIKVQVSFTDLRGYSEGPLTSDAYPSTGTVVAAAGACPSDYDWCATMTVEDQSGTGDYPIYNDKFGMLTNNPFQHHGETFNVFEIYANYHVTEVEVLIDVGPMVPRGTVFKFGDHTFTADEESQGAQTQDRWPIPSDLFWYDGQEITVSLVFGNFPAEATISISGMVESGQTLTATISDISDTDGLTNPVYTYQWIRVDNSSETDIPGATQTNYTLVADDVGKQVKIKISFTDDEGNAEAVYSDAYPPNGTVANTFPTGQPTISGNPWVGHTLTADPSGIMDNDGLSDPPGWSYQWLRFDADGESNQTDIGTDDDEYTLVAADVGKKIKVQVSFTDNGGTDETVLSDAHPLNGTVTPEVTPEPNRRGQIVFVPLTARFRDVPTGHDGTMAFTLMIAFSERIEITEDQMQQALTVTGGTVTSAREVTGFGDRWEITVTPNSNDDVSISLPPTTSCSAAGAICTSNGSKMLQRGRSVSIPRAPLTARFAEVPAGHHGTTPFALQLAFSEPVETTAAALEQALTVTNATVTSVQQVDDRSDRWEITVTPNSNDDVNISLPQTTSCDDDNAVCTAAGRMLSEGIAVSVARAPLTARFESVPTGHIGIPFTLQLAFSEPIRITVATLTQALTVTGGRMNSLQRVNRRSDLWEVQIQPDAADVNVSLPKSASCDDEGAVCTEDGIVLQNDAQADIPFLGYLMPHTLDKVSGNEQTGPASTQLAESFVVFAADEEGAALTGVIVTFTVTAGGGMLSATTNANPCIFKAAKSSITAITDANGQAATRLTLGSEPGTTNTVAVSVPGLESETFTATATEQAMPHTLATVCGEDQEGTAGQRLAEPLVVLVSDENGAAIAGVAVSFAVTAGGGMLTTTTDTTNATGRARTWLMLGSELGTNTVEATVDGLAPVTFTATGQESPLVSFFDAFQNGSGKLVALPDSPQLAQNAPNPFNSQTVLAYFLPAAGPVRLEVFSLTGQRVAVLRHGPQQAGYHRLRWHGHDDAGRSQASGIYLYRLVTDEGSLTRKLTLLR